MESWHYNATNVQTFSLVEGLSSALRARSACKLFVILGGFTADDTGQRSGEWPTVRPAAFQAARPILRALRERTFTCRGCRAPTAPHPRHFFPRQLVRGSGGEVEYRD